MVVVLRLNVLGVYMWYTGVAASNVDGTTDTSDDSEDPAETAESTVLKSEFRDS